MATEREKELMAKKTELTPLQRKLTAGANIIIDDTIDTISSIPPTISITNTQNTGDKVADIAVNSTTTSLYAQIEHPIELTTIEYEQLTQEQKMDGNKIYFVKDQADVSVWIGTETEYYELPISIRSKEGWLFVIKEGNE